MGRHSASDEDDTAEDETDNELAAYIPWDEEGEPIRNPWVAGVLAGACVTLMFIVLLVWVIDKLMG